MKNMTFEVVGSNKMHCGGCESAVKFVLSDLPGVQDVQATHTNQHIVIQYDETQVLERALILEELDQLGYQVKEIER